MDSMTLAEKLAFPLPGWDESGMTLLDYFAAKALQGELASQADDFSIYSEESYKGLATESYKIAIEMMKAREAAHHKLEDRE